MIRQWLARAVGFAPALALVALTAGDAKAQFSFRPFGFIPGPGAYSYNPGPYRYDPGLMGGYYGGGDYRRFYSYGRDFYPGLYPGYANGWSRYAGPGYYPAYGPGGPMVGANPYGTQPNAYPSGQADSGSDSTGPASRRTDNAVSLQVQVPADAELWIEGTRTQQTGPTRQFVSPPLTPGQSYTYEIRAQWTEDGKEVTKTQRLSVRAGERRTVSFFKPEQQGPKQKIEEFKPPKPKTDPDEKPAPKDESE